MPGPDGDREVGIVRAHLEEDAAKTIHVGGEGGRIQGADHSLVDFNRGGTPLVEIVAEPDIRSGDEARRFLQLLRQTVVELEISDAEMEKGSLRCDANVSVREVGEAGYRTKTELKNMNSFKFVADGIAAEVERQIALYESGAGGRAADAPLRPPGGHDRAAPLQGGGARLPLLPGAGPGRDRAPGGAGGAGTRGDRRAPGRANPASRAGGGLRPRLRPRHQRARRVVCARARRRPARGRQRAHEPACRGGRRPREA